MPIPETQPYGTVHLGLCRSTTSCDFRVNLPRSRRSALADAASDTVAEIPPSTRSSSLHDMLARPHLVHLCTALLQASTSGFARLPLSYARNGADRLPQIMQTRQCTVALVAFYWTRLCGTAWIWRQSDAHLENAAAFLLRHCDVTRESTNSVYAADRRPACILEELYDTPWPWPRHCPCDLPLCVPALCQPWI